MKILILSDSHGDSKTMCDAVQKEQLNTIIYLGDGIEDAEVVRRKYPHIQMIMNLGNIDSHDEDEEWIKYTDICGKRFMMTHGHTFYTGIEITQDVMADARSKILRLMSENNIDITLHGHIHEPFIYYYCLGASKNGWIMCPGRIGRYTDLVKPIYGVLKINESGAVEWQFVEMG